MKISEISEKFKTKLAKITNLYLRQCMETNVELLKKRSRLDDESNLL